MNIDASKDVLPPYAAEFFMLLGWSDSRAFSVLASLARGSSAGNGDIFCLLPDVLDANDLPFVGVKFTIDTDTREEMISYACFAQELKNFYGPFIARCTSNRETLEAMLSRVIKRLESLEQGVCELVDGRHPSALSLEEVLLKLR